MTQAIDIDIDTDALAWQKQEGLLPAIVQDADSLAREVAQLWQSRDDWQAMSEAGLAVLRRNQGALARLLGGIQRLLP